MISNVNVVYERILVAVDFSSTSRKAFYRAVGMRKIFDADLHILHVREHNLAAGGFDQVEFEVGELERLEQGLVRRLDELQEEGLVSAEERERMTLHIRGGGKPFVEIVKYAEDKKCDLIVMGTHGHTGIKHIFLGSQAERVVRRAGCDVLCVHPDDYGPQLPS